MRQRRKTKSMKDAIRDRVEMERIEEELWQEYQIAKWGEPMRKFYEFDADLSKRKARREQ